MTRLAPARSFPASIARSRPRWWQEILLLGLVYLMYDGVRMVVSAGHHEAFTNAHRVLALERVLRLAHEEPINRAVSGDPVLAITLSYAYAALHYLVTPVVLLWLWKRRPERYRGARTALVVATLLGLIGFWLFPTAPPRMLPGFVDTLAKYHDWGWWNAAASAPRGLGGLTNEFAAMPSLHVGWAAWCGWQVGRNTARRWVQVLAAAYPVLILTAVIGTANHYLADTVAGIGVITVGMLAVRISRTVRAYALF
jgi:hypothetical protein